MLILQTVLFLVLFILVVNLALGRDALQSLLFSVALAVGLTPEFLPMITTVTLAQGAIRMAREKVIVKHLSVDPEPGQHRHPVQRQDGHAHGRDDVARRVARSVRARLGADALPRASEQPLRDGDQEPARRRHPRASERRERGIPQDRRDPLRLRAAPPLDRGGEAGRLAARHEGRAGGRARRLLEPRERRCGSRARRADPGALPGHVPRRQRARLPRARRRIPQRAARERLPGGRRARAHAGRLPDLRRSRPRGGRRLDRAPARRRRGDQDPHRRQRARHAPHLRPGRDRRRTHRPRQRARRPRRDRAGPRRRAVGRLRARLTGAEAPHPPRPQGGRPRRGLPRRRHQRRAFAARRGRGHLRRGRRRRGARGLGHHPARAATRRAPRAASSRAASPSGTSSSTC